MSVVLVKLPGGEGAIHDDDGTFLLTRDVTVARGRPLNDWDRYEPVKLGLGDNRVLVGGLLPPGAVNAEAVEGTGVRTPAGVGGGAFAVIFADGPRSEGALAYRDADGRFVHRPLAAAYPHEPITDADEPCPVCGEIEYELHFVTEQWRAGRGRKGTDSFRASPLIVCRVCGHQEHVSAISRYGGARADRDRDGPAREARRAQALAEQIVQRWYTDKMTLTWAAFSIYTAEGWPARVNASRSREGQTTSVTVAHADPLPDTVPIRRPPIEITTSSADQDRTELIVAREAFGRLAEADGHRELGEDRSDAAVTLWFGGADRRRRFGAHGAPVDRIEITIDGAAAPFVLVGRPDAHWVAVRRHENVTVTITGRDIDPRSLDVEPIADPDARLLGPEPVER